MRPTFYTVWEDNGFCSLGYVGATPLLDEARGMAITELQRLYAGRPGFGRAFIKDVDGNIIGHFEIWGNDSMHEVDCNSHEDHITDLCAQNPNM